MKRLILSFLLLLSICLSAKPACELNVREFAQRFSSSYNKAKSSYSINTVEFINNEFFFFPMQLFGAESSAPNIVFSSTFVLYAWLCKKPLTLNFCTPSGFAGDKSR